MTNAVLGFEQTDQLHVLRQPRVANQLLPFSDRSSVFLLDRGKITGGPLHDVSHRHAPSSGALSPMQTRSATGTHRGRLSWYWRARAATRRPPPPRALHGPPSSASSPCPSYRRPRARSHRRSPRVSPTRRSVRRPDRPSSPPPPAGVRANTAAHQG